MHSAEFLRKVPPITGAVLYFPSLDPAPINRYRRSATAKCVKYIIVSDLIFGERKTTNRKVKLLMRPRAMIIGMMPVIMMESAGVKSHSETVSSVMFVKALQSLDATFEPMLALSMQSLLVN